MFCRAFWLEVLAAEAQHTRDALSALVYCQRDWVLWCCGAVSIGTLWASDILFAVVGAQKVTLLWVSLSNVTLSLKIFKSFFKGSRDYSAELRTCSWLLLWAASAKTLQKAMCSDEAHIQSTLYNYKDSIADIQVCFIRWSRIFSSLDSFCTLLQRPRCWTSSKWPTSKSAERVGLHLGCLVF